MPLTDQQKAVLDLVGNQLHARELWTSGRELRGQMAEGSAAEKTGVLDSLVPAYLVRDGQPPQERYRFTLEGAFESSFGHAVGQFLRDLLDVLKALGRRDSTFDAYSIDDIRRGSHHIALAFPDDYRWIDFVIRIAGLCADPDGAPQGGPWHIPEDIETLLECKDVQALRKLRRGDLYDPTGRVMDPKTFGLEDVHIALLDRIAEYELEHAEPTPINHALLAEPPERENDVREWLDVLSAKDCIEITGFSGPELLPLRAWGLLASKCAARSDTMIRRLLSYFRDRLADEGVKFHEFTWENLKTAGVAADDSEFCWFVQLIHLLGLQNGSTQTATQPPQATWRIPRDIAQLRAANNIADILVQDGFKPRERQPERGEASSSREPMMTADSKIVFIVHGRDHVVRDRIDLFLTKDLGLATKVMEAEPNRGRSLPEKFEEIAAECAFAVFILTADDHLQDLNANKTLKRARQNVILEVGYFWGRLGRRGRVVFLVDSDAEMELPSDIQGLGWIAITSDLGETKRKLEKELRDAGLL